MKQTLLFLFVGFAAALVAAPVSKAPVDLLAGKTLTDFRCPAAKTAAEVAATYSLVDGVLTMNGSHPLVLTTKERWRDFELSAEIQYADAAYGDGGLAILLGDGARTQGLEFQLKTTGIGDLWGWPGLVHSRSAQVAPVPGAGYHCVERLAPVTRTPGVWHRLHIRAFEGEIVCSWDGREVNRCTVRAPRAGHIGFQTQPYGKDKVTILLRNVVLTPYEERPLDLFASDDEYLKLKWRIPTANPSTGLEREEFAQELAKLVEKYEPVEDWSFVKARIFAFGCDRAAIGVSHHDWYPAFASWHYHRQHPFGSLMGRRAVKVDDQFTPGLRKQIGEAWKSGQCSIWKDYCHCSPDWDRILALGFCGMKDELLAHWKDNVYCQSKLMAIDAVLRLLDRLIAETEAEIVRDPGPRLPKELASLKRLRAGRPETAYDALQFIYLFWVICENFDKYQARTLGNIDRLLTPYYRADLAAGRTTEAEFRDQLAHFWWQWGSINNYWGQPVYIGGTRADGTTEYNEVSKIVLDIHDQLALPTPKMHVKIAANTPDWVWTRTLDMVRRNRSISFCGEEPIMRVMRSRGIPEEDVRTFALWGCYEWGRRNFCVSGGSCVHKNLLKDVELTLADAKDGKIPEPKTFDDFKREVYKRLVESAANALRLARLNDGHRVDVNPSNMIALSVEKSVNAGIEPLDLNPNGGVMIIGLGTTVDALQAVREIVYERKECTLQELGRIMAANWKGHEQLRLRMLRSKRKWGNNDPETNALGKELVAVCAANILNQPTGRGGRYGMSGHSARQHIELGRRMGATPDGRLAGEEMSKNLSPTMGADTEGVTALIDTLANLDARDLPGDFPLDVALLPATVAGEKGLALMRTIVEQYFKNGGMVIQFNIHDPKMLRDAQKHPEKYENLQVRVCGWNVRWNDMPRVEQEKYILRVESLAE